jgi:hypothetical protein
VHSVHLAWPPYSSSRTWLHSLFRIPPQSYLATSLFLTHVIAGGTLLSARCGCRQHVCAGPCTATTGAGNSAVDMLVWDNLIVQRRLVWLCFKCAGLRRSECADPCPATTGAGNSAVDVLDWNCLFVQRQVSVALLKMRWIETIWMCWPMRCIYRCGQFCCWCVGLKLYVSAATGKRGSAFNALDWDDLNALAHALHRQIREFCCRRVGLKLYVCAAMFVQQQVGVALLWMRWIETIWMCWPMFCNNR